MRGRKLISEKWNCNVESKEDTLIITPSEEIVNCIHYNLKHKHKVVIKRFNEKSITEVFNGMNWFCLEIN